MASVYSFEDLVHLYDLDESNGLKKISELRKIYNRVYKSKRSFGTDEAMAALAAYIVVEEQIKPIVEPIDEKIEKFLKMKNDGVDILKIMESIMRH